MKGFRGADAAALSIPLGQSRSWCCKSCNSGVETTPTSLLGAIELRAEITPLLGAWLLCFTMHIVSCVEGELELNPTPGAGV